MVPTPLPTLLTIYPARPRLVGRLLADALLTGGLLGLVATSKAGPGLVAASWLLVLVVAGQTAREMWAFACPQPLLQLSAWGIRLGKRPLDSWADIQWEWVTTSRSPRGHQWLRYQVGPANRQLDMSVCGISQGELAVLLRYYRQRSAYLAGQPC